MKQCYVCKQNKPKTEFGSHAARQDGLQTYCKACSKGEQTKWYYKRKYGITLEERDALLASQDHKCAICKDTIKFFDGYRAARTGESAVIDHCHGSGKVRGVLCGHCNTGIGALKDNVDSLKRAIEYLS